jgi:hypothetical protein
MQVRVLLLCRTFYRDLCCETQKFSSVGRLVVSRFKQTIGIASPAQTGVESPSGGHQGPIVRFGATFAGNWGAAALNSVGFGNVGRAA